MRNRYFLTLIIILLNITSSLAQIEIKVFDETTRKPLPAANIAVLESEKVFVTDNDGAAVLNIDPPATLNISFVGYASKKLKLEDNELRSVYLEPNDKLLDEVTVVGFDNNRKLIETPGAIFMLKPKDIRRYDETSLVRGLNTIPGVRMEQRSPGSYRISIRGSSLRAPFDVRNVKIYWNGIPFTDPNGITPLNLLDLNQMGKVEVIKGPAASIYGAGGGVVSITSPRADFDQNDIQVGTMWGSYGLQRYTASYRTGDANSNINVNFNHQETNGYREHTAFDRNTAQVFASFYPSDKRTLTANVFYSDLFYQVPGGLTREQFEENPKQARPSGYYPGSVAQNSSVDYKAFLTSLSQDYRWNDHFENTTSVYGLFSFFEMPFILDFEREARQGLGGRTSFDYSTQLGSLPTKITVGGEYQRALLIGRNFGNVGGQADSIRFDDEVNSWQTLLFAKTDIDLPYETFLTVGLSYNDLKYDINRLTDAINDTSYQFLKPFNAVWAPRVGLLKKLLPNLSVQGSISKGFSPPSVKEVRTGEGSINRDLEAEKGMNYELGLRGTILNNLIDFDITAFSFELSETIVSFTDSAGVTRFRNTGATSQQGLEVNTMINFIDQPGRFINFLRLQNAYTFHHFRFDNYIKEGEDYSGNQLTGVAPHILVATIDMITKPGIYMNLSYNFTDEIPLNDANTVYADAYNLFDLKMGLEKEIGILRLDFFAGINNLFDETYSLGNDLNPFGGRYFQPAPDRNYYLGVKAEF